MLIASNRHKPEDIEFWSTHHNADALRANDVGFWNLVRVAKETVCDFMGRGKCYASVSWGKDSVVLASIVASLSVPPPLVWVKVEPIYNPDCIHVRDAFLKSHPHVIYDEIQVECTHDKHGWHATGTLERGFKTANNRWGPKYISGVRAEESGDRTRRVRSYGLSSKNTCAPLGHWKFHDVMAYLVYHDLPIHPAYAMSGGGRYDRSHIRVASLGGKRGDNRGRKEWEEEYYGDVLRRLQVRKKPER